MRTTSSVRLMTMIVSPSRLLPSCRAGQLIR
jgi:hypothetical protein